MKYFCILMVLGISLQSQARSVVESEATASDCCFRMVNDVDLIIKAAEEVRKNFKRECNSLYGDLGYVTYNSQKVLELKSFFGSGGASVKIKASAICLKSRD